jgi:DNA-binding IclR family transcriptional regulator
LTPKRKRRDPRINVALGRGLEILRAFRPEEVQLGNIEIARRTGIPKGTVSRLTYTLTAFGYLRYSEVTGMFAIAPGILALGYSVLLNNAIHLIARPLMQELALETDSAVGLGVRDGAYVIHLEYARGTTAVIRDIAAGFRISIAGSATGWACLAGMRPEERDAALKQIRAELAAKDWRVFSVKLKKAMSEVWDHGFCISIGDVDPGFNAVAAPFLHEGRRESYVLNCIGPGYLFKRERLVQEVGPRLMRLTEELRRRSAGVSS